MPAGLAGLIFEASAHKARFCDGMEVSTSTRVATEALSIDAFSILDRFTGSLSGYDCARCAAWNQINHDYG